MDALTWRWHIHTHTKAKSLSPVRVEAAGVPGQAHVVLHLQSSVLLLLTDVFSFQLVLSLHHAPQHLHMDTFYIMHMQKKKGESTLLFKMTERTTEEVNTPHHLLFCRAHWHAADTQFEFFHLSRKRGFIHFFFLFMLCSNGSSSHLPSAWTGLWCPSAQRSFFHHHWEPCQAGWTTLCSPLQCCSEGPFLLFHCSFLKRQSKNKWYTHFYFWYSNTCIDWNWLSIF